MLNRFGRGSKSSPSTGFPGQAARDLFYTGVVEGTTGSIGRSDESHATDPGDDISEDGSGDPGNRGAENRSSEREPTGAVDDPRAAVHHRRIDDRGRETLPTVAPDRQVLIVGEGVHGLALAVALERMGIEPVLLSGGEPPDRSAVSTLWPASMAILDRLGVGEAVRDRGRELDAVRVRTADGTGTTLGGDDSSFSPQVIVGTDGIRTELRNCMGSSTNLVSTDVSSIRERSDALEAGFENGVSEFFDVIVGTNGPASSVRTSTESSPVEAREFRQFEVRFDATGRPQVAVDHWDDGRFVQLLPGPGTDADWVVRLTTRERPDDPAGVARRVLSSTPSRDDHEEAPSVISKPLSTTGRKVWQTRRGAGEWRDGRIAYCGSAAHAVPPATGLAVTLGLEDAWALADELRRGPEATTDVLTRYQRRRQRRLRSVAERSPSLAGAESVFESESGPLEEVRHYRTVALGGYRSRERP